MAAETPSLDAIFCAAIEIAAEADRAAYLAQACGGDPDLRGRVQKLLEALTGHASLEAARAAGPANGSWPIRSVLLCPGLHAAPGALPLRTRQALERIIDVYVAWGKADKAAEWRQKLDAGKKMENKSGAAPPSARKPRASSSWDRPEPAGRAL
jgi:hypothetical protein